MEIRRTGFAAVMLGTLLAGFAEAVVIHRGNRYTEAESVREEILLLVVATEKLQARKTEDYTLSVEGRVRSVGFVAAAGRIARTGVAAACKVAVLGGCCWHRPGRNSRKNTLVKMHRHQQQIKSHSRRQLNKAMDKSGIRNSEGGE